MGSRGKAPCRDFGAEPPTFYLPPPPPQKHERSNKMVKAIVGANWGDEGKGKITDAQAAQSDIVVRFQGGANAGHTIINEHGKFALHQLPSGVFFKHITNVIANGVALNVPSLLKEMETVTSVIGDINLIISDRTQLVLPHHVLLDTLEEQRLADRMFGSTKSGIAPFYSDKFLKVGVQIWQLYNDTDLKEKLRTMYERVNSLLVNLYKAEPINYLEVYDTLMGYAEQIKKYVTDTGSFLRKAAKEGKTILLEGQLGALRDVDHGIYPYVTSSSPLAGYASVGSGIPPYEIKQIIAVTKAYSSCVGEGPFVPELFGDEAEELRKRGGDSGEYGATTGRPRRVGFFDCVATRYGCEAQGATEVSLTCLDVLAYLDKIPVCVGYELDGKVHKQFLPTTLQYKAKPVFEFLDGFKCDIRGIKAFDLLPENAQKYVRFIEKEIGVPITIVSNGPKRDDIIEVK